MEETKESLNTLFEEYFYWITYTNDCFELYKHLRTSQKNYLKQMNLSPAFFQLSWSALLHTALVDLAKFYDKDRQNSLSLRNLLRICEENKSLFRKKYYKNLSLEMRGAFSNNDINIDEVLRDCAELLESMSENVQKLKEVRDKKLAHSDKNADDFIFYENGLTRTIVRLLIGTAANICRKLSVCLTGNDHACQSSNVFDVDNLFKKLTENEK